MLTTVTINHSPEHPVEEIVQIKWVGGIYGATNPHRITIHNDMKETDVVMIVSEREHHTIWAALRMLQLNLEVYDGWPKGMPLTDVASNGGEIEPLTTEEIDGLLMERNLGAIQPLNLDRMAWDKIKDDGVKEAVKVLLAGGCRGAAETYLFHACSLGQTEAGAAVDWAVSEMEKEKGNDEMLLR